jgi:two-component system response regulator YesN
MRGWTIQEVMQEDRIYFSSLERLVAKEQVIEWMHRVVRRVLEYQLQLYREGNKEVVHKIASLVDTRLNETISLQEIAERLYMNASYLSRLFKQEMGESFTSYVTKRKMEKAREWLVQGEKSTVVADRLGYNDDSYFTKVFRKYWGVSPSMVKI